jgi:Phosphodiester glycosidase
MAMAVAAAPIPTPRRGDTAGSCRRFRVTLIDGAATTLYLVRYAADRTAVRLVVLARPQPLAGWCTAQGVREALVGGFFTLPTSVPLGELRTAGIARPSVPFLAPWDRVRACLRIAGGTPSIAPRNELAVAPVGDLLQAGPLLVRGGERLMREDEDPEGFSAGAQQFRSDITVGRYPRAALALAEGAILAVACDGRSASDAGLSLVEFADLLVLLGAHTAINLDGGGSTSLVSGGRLQNCPREDFDQPLLGGRPLATALVFEPRSPSTRPTGQSAPARLTALAGPGRLSARPHEAPAPHMWSVDSSHVDQ